MGNFFNSRKSRMPPWFHCLCVSFPVILFHSKSTQIGITGYNLNVKYRIGYRYRQISVIKNRNIGISVFSHIGASLIIIICNLSSQSVIVYINYIYYCNCLTCTVENEHEDFSEQLLSNTRSGRLTNRFLSLLESGLK